MADHLPPALADHHPADLAAAGIATTAPVWVPWLDGINAVLTTVSLVLGIAFLAWRWRRSAARLPSLTED